MRNKDFKIDNMIDDILTIWNKKLLKEWHPTKNGDLKLSDFKPFSNKKVWWLCEKGHEWQAVIGTRSKGVGCPYCKGLLPTLETCLQTTFPELAEQWHPVKNGTITPYDVLPKSNKSYWWRCNKDHEWNNSPQKKIRDGKVRGCPYCANKKVWPGYNDAATTHPHVIPLWHPTKNIDILPTQISAGSNKKVWWLCEKGHEWQTPISYRKDCNCPICNESKGELKIREYLLNNEINFKREVRFDDCKDQLTLPFDFVIYENNEILGVVEFDGIQHFKPIKIFGGKKALTKTKNHDSLKTDYCLMKNIPLLRILYEEFDKIEEMISSFLTECNKRYGPNNSVEIPRF